MNLSRKEHRFVILVLVLLISMVGLSCSFLSGLSSKSTETPVPAPTESIATQEAPPTDEPIPATSVPTEAQEPTAVIPTEASSVIPDRPLGTGPWLLIQADDGMWAVNPDGSGLTYLTAVIPNVTHDLENMTSPRGGAFAFVTTSDPLKMSDLTLMLLRLPNSSLEIVTRLTSDKTEPAPDAQPGSEAFNVVFTLSALDNLDWSPDGRQLAFMGAMDGPSSDLYVYSLASGEMTQLTDGPSQGIRPTWSPDGKVIVHAGVGSLGTGAGYDVQGIWAAKADDSGVITLYPIPGESGDELILGWVSPDRFLVYTWNVVCGTKNLRMYNIADGTTKVLWPDFFSSVIFSPESGTALVGVDEWTVDCNPGGLEGTFLLRPGQVMPLMALDVGSPWMDWVPSAGVFLVRSETKLYSISPEGELKWLTEASDEGLPAISADGRMWAFAASYAADSPGLWVGQFGGETELVFPQGCWDATWSPGGEGLFFFGADGLYFAPAPSFEPVLIGDGMGVTLEEPTTWVYP